MNEAKPFNVLLVEPVNLLRRTVSLTLRSLGTAEITEAANYQTARQFCGGRPFDAAVIALELPQPSVASLGLVLIHQIRLGQCASPSSIPIAVLVDSCDAELLSVLRSCQVSRVLIKPFRVRDVIDTIDGMRGSGRIAAAH